MKVFVEEQRFSRWIFLSILMIPILAGVIPLLTKNKDFPKMYSDGFWGLAITFITVSFALSLILSIKLKTKIDELGIHYKFFPFHINEKFISWDNLKKCYLTKYNSLTQYGGYGYRISFSKKKGTALNVGGNYGIQLELKSGKRLLIGTQKQQEIEAVLKTYQTKLSEE